MLVYSLMTGYMVIVNWKVVEKTLHKLQLHYSLENCCGGKKALKPRSLHLVLGGSFSLRTSRNKT